MRGDNRFPGGARGGEGADGQTTAERSGAARARGARPTRELPVSGEGLPIPEPVLACGSGPRISLEPARQEGAPSSLLAPPAGGASSEDRRRIERAGVTTGCSRSSKSFWDREEEVGTAPLLGAELEPGARVRQYEILQKIGEGGMGVVFLAQDLRLGRHVAIKFLHASQPELTQRFLIEARATARCQHDNIVVVYEVGELGDSPYIVLEFLHGQPLSALTGRGQRLPYPRAVEIMCAVVRALRCAHGQGIVHRDLKPDNVFLTDGGSVKVLDFGIAKVLQGEPPRTSALSPRLPSPIELTMGNELGLTQVGTIMGTVQYMSPEQWGLEVDIDHRTDLWACGILLYRMICGQHPLHPLEGNQLMSTAQLAVPMPSLAAAAPPEVPRELVEVVDRCLMKAKAQRWQSAGELLAALEPFLPARSAPEVPLSVYAAASRPTGPAASSSAR